MIIKVGHFMIAAAVVDVVAAPLWARSMRRANPAASPQSKQSIRFIVGAALVGAAVLVLLALFLPEAQIPIFSPE